jgi:hypothetical protein
VLRHRCIELGSRRAALMMCVALMLAGCGGSSSSALCAATLDFDGRTYSGYGDVKTLPPPSQTLGRGTIPRCDDDDTRETVRVRALNGLDPAVAVVVGQEDIYIADDLEQFPDRIQAYFDQVECSTDRPFRVEGQWTAISPRPRPSESRPLEDPSPNIKRKPPYRITVLVQDGADGGDKYRRSYVDIKVTPATTPYLDREDMKVALWDPGTVIAHVHCEGAEFVADAVDASDNSA